MHELLTAIDAEFRRYRALAEAAMDQLEDGQLAVPLGCGDADATDNSVATIAWHLGGNLRSRFTDFLTTDGEKPWRDRDAEFAARQPARHELLAQWNGGWEALFGSLAALGPDDLERQITIRQQPMSVARALSRALGHAAYHCGQIVYVAKALRGPAWRSLSIPPGGSQAYAQNPTNELGDAHARDLQQRRGR